MNKDQEEAIRELSCLRESLQKDLVILFGYLRDVELLAGTCEEAQALENVRLKAMHIHWQAVDIPMRCRALDEVHYGK